MRIRALHGGVVACAPDDGDFLSCFYYITCFYVDFFLVGIVPESAGYGIINPDIIAASVFAPGCQSFSVPITTPSLTDRILT